MDKFCECDKPFRKIYTDTCTNCGLNFKEAHNTNSNANPFEIPHTIARITHHGRRIDIVGNKVLIMDKSDTRIEHQFIGHHAADTMNKIEDWFAENVKRKTEDWFAPQAHTPEEHEEYSARRTAVAKSEIMGILRRRRSAEGECKWYDTDDIRSDFNARLPENTHFVFALFEIHCDKAVEFRRGTKRIKLCQDIASHD